MGSVNNIKIILEAQDEATEPIEQVTEATKRLGRESRKVTKDSKKDWGGLGDLFSQVLPRSLQSLTRGFKGTQRQVGRLSKSFKVLKTAWASIGIGLVIIALEELISNWDKITEYIGLYNKEAEDTAKRNKEIANEQAELNRHLVIYNAQISMASTTDAERKKAVEELNKVLGGGIDVEADRLTQIEQSNALMEANKILIKARTDAEWAENRAQKEGNKIRDKSYKDLGVTEKFEISALEFRQKKAKDIRALETQAAKYLDIQIGAEKVLNDLIGTTNKTISARQEAIKEASDAERKAKSEADAAKKRAKADKEADAKWLANQRIQLAQETELRLIQDEEKRELRSLEIQHEAAKAELTLRGGTLKDKLALEKKYTLDKEDVEKDYQDRADAQTAIDDQKAIDDAAQLTEALATEQENEIQRVKDRYALLQELAVEDSEESKDLTEKARLEIEAINKKFDDKEVADAQKVQDLKLQAVNKMVNSVSGLLGNLSDLAEGNSEQQKKLAVVDILINQAVAMANAVAGAAKAAKDGGPGAPFLFAAYVATMLGTVAGTFASIKGIMSEADAVVGGGGGSMGGGGGGFVSNIQVPLPARLDTPDSMQAYVVQSQLQGQMNAQGRLEGQIIL